MPHSHGVFKYDPLPASAGDSLITRLLVLLPDKDPSAKIRCELKQVCLKEKPSYDAISYCWGDQTATQSILCNEDELEVTLNLDTALHRLRQSQTTRTLWADAICINQTNAVERSQQVQIMRNIYEGAEKVLIWLGDSTRNSQRAIRLAENIAETTNNGYNPATLSPILRSGRSASLIEDGVLPLKALLRRPWFRRVWVVQEVAVAKRVVLLCGQDEISWDSLVAALVVLDELGILTTRNSLDFERLGLPLLINDARLRYCGTTPHFLSRAEKPPFTHLNCFRSEDMTYKDPLRSVFITPEREGILNFPLWFRRMNASDPRDKLFALYGLTENTVYSIPLTLDYTRDVSEVYHEFAILMLRRTQALDILSTPRSATQSARGLPSWVPDWSDSGN